jgi:hypothetical protein
MSESVDFIKCGFRDTLEGSASRHVMRKPGCHVTLPLVNRTIEGISELFSRSVVN